MSIDRFVAIFTPLFTHGRTHFDIQSWQVQQERGMAPPLFQWTPPGDAAKDATPELNCKYAGPYSSYHKSRRRAAFYHSDRLRYFTQTGHLGAGSKSGLFPGAARRVEPDGVNTQCRRAADIILNTVADMDAFVRFDARVSKCGAKRHRRRLADAELLGGIVKVEVAVDAETPGAGVAVAENAEPVVFAERFDHGKGVIEKVDTVAIVHKHLKRFGTFLLCPLPVVTAAAQDVLE